MPSIALILHLADGNTGSVSLKCAEIAAAWCEYLESHANKIYSIAINAKQDTALLIAKRLNKPLMNGFTCRDVYRKQWAGLTNKSLVQAGLDYLVDEDWLKPYILDTGGAPKTTYFINPKVAEMKI